MFYPQNRIIMKNSMSHNFWMHSNADSLWFQELSECPDSDLDLSRLWTIMMKNIPEAHLKNENHTSCNNWCQES